MEEREIQPSTSRQETISMLMDLDDILDISAMEYQMEQEHLVEQKYERKPSRQIEQTTFYNISGNPEYTYTQYAPEIKSFKAHLPPKTHTMPQLAVPPPTTLSPDLWYLVSQKLETAGEKQAIGALEQTTSAMLFPTPARRLKQFLSRMNQAGIRVNVQTLVALKLEALSLAVKSDPEIQRAGVLHPRPTAEIAYEAVLLIDDTTCILRYIYAFKTMMHFYVYVNHEENNQVLVIFVGTAFIRPEKHQEIVGCTMTNYTSYLKENEKPKIKAAVESFLWQFVKRALPEFYT